MRRLCRGCWLCLLAVLVAAAPAWGVETTGEPSPEEIRRLSLEDLLAIKVTSVSKKPERLTRAAAAVYVLTGEEIRRAGVTTLADALRLVPGLTVAQADAHTWAVSSRGFSSTVANKLEVLLDGRSLYTPLFSGVFWDAQDTLLEDVDRIEVIRGPGATLWGTNAVNGVINILTKSAADTVGSMVQVAAGNEDRARAAARHGWQLAGGGHVRVYAKGFDRDASERSGSAEPDDEWSQAQGGFRFDRGSEAEAGGKLTLQGDVYGGRAGQETTLTVPVEGAVGSIELAGANLLGRWRRQLERGGLQLQVYYDRTHRELPGVFAEDRDIFDVDFQHEVSLGARHELIWGMGYRLSADDVTNSEFVSWRPPSRNLQHFSLFAQDEVAWSDGRLKLTFGTKLEHNDYTGFEWQPSVRLLWSPDERRAVWAALSRAVRSPSRLDSDSRILFLTSDQPPIGFLLLGSQDFQAEELVAYELGHRIQLGDRLSFDVAAFYNDYDRLTSIEVAGPPVFEDGRLSFPFVFDNQLEGTSYGVELATFWEPFDGCRLRAAWSFFDLDLEPLPGSTDTGSEAAEGNDPRHQLSLRSMFDLPSAWRFDAVVRFVDELPNPEVPSYVELDLRLAHELQRGWSFALVGRNLLDDQHRELGGLATEVERSFYAELTWRF